MSDDAKPKQPIVTSVKIQGNRLDVEVKVPIVPRKLENIEIHSVSLVSHCPYCGSDNFEKSAKHPHTGEQCYHPTRLGGPLKENK